MQSKLCGVSPQDYSPWTPPEDSSNLIRCTRIRWPVEWRTLQKASSSRWRVPSVRRMVKELKFPGWSLTTATPWTQRMRVRSDGLSVPLARSFRAKDGQRVEFPGWSLTTATTWTPAKARTAN